MIQQDAHPAIPSPSAFLTLAQIHRVLRPLRTKVLALSKSITAASAKSRGKQTSVSVFQERNPLAIVPHPSRFHFSTRSSSVLSEWDPASHELDTELPIIDFARKAHAISDAFRNVVTRAYGDELSQRMTTIPPLMEIATAIIGDDIEASVMELLQANKPLNSDDTSFETDEDDEDDETYIIDGCYEQIPEHLRRWALVPHAVKMILIRAPNSPTILETCLDIALEHGSTRDALCFLRRVLSVAFTRRPSDDIPIKSSQHGDYLVHLLRKPNHPSTPITSAWSDLQFTDEVISAISLLEEEDQGELWCSVALRALFSAVSETSRLSLVSAFSTFCATYGGGRFGKRQLRPWVEQILCASVLSQMGTTAGVDTGRGPEEVDMGLCLSEVSLSMGTLVDEGPLPSVAEFFRDTFISLATHTLSVSHMGDGECPKSYKVITNLLFPLASTTSPSSFNPLTSAISEAFLVSQDITRFVELVLSHARPLREARLYQMEAALLAAALNDLENEEEPAPFRVECVDRSICTLRTALAEAEARCVEGDGAGTKWRYDEDHGWVTATPAVVPKVPPREALPSLSSSVKRKRPLRIEDDEDEDEDDPHGPAKRLQIQNTPYFNRLDDHWGSSPDPICLNTPRPGPRTALRRGIAAKPPTPLGRLSSLSFQLAAAGEDDEVDDDVEREGEVEAVKASDEPTSRSDTPINPPIMDVELGNLSFALTSPHLAASPRLGLGTLRDQATNARPPTDLAFPSNPELPETLPDPPPPRRLLNLPTVPRTVRRSGVGSGRDSLPPRLAQALRRMSGSGLLGLSRGKN